MRFLLPVCLCLAAAGCSPLWVSSKEVSIVVRFYPDSTCQITADGADLFPPDYGARAQALPASSTQDVDDEGPSFDLRCNRLESEPGYRRLGSAFLFLRTPTPGTPPPGSAWYHGDSPTVAPDTGMRHFDGLVEAPKYADDFFALLSTGSIHLEPVAGTIHLDQAGPPAVGIVRFRAKKVWGW